MPAIPGELPATSSPTVRSCTTSSALAPQRVEPGYGATVEPCGSSSRRRQLLMLEAAQLLDVARLLGDLGQLLVLDVAGPALGPRCPRKRPPSSALPPPPPPPPATAATPARATAQHARRRTAEGRLQRSCDLKGLTHLWFPVTASASRGRTVARSAVACL
jgi:hypothetical protein